MKRAISLLLSLSMVFSMAAPVFADGSVSETTEAPAITQDVTSVPEEATSVPEEATSVPEETTSVPEEATSVPEEATSVPEETTSVPEEDPSDSSELSAAPQASDSEFVEITDVKDLKADGIYAIGYLPDDKGGSILYNNNTATTADQVTGTFVNGKLQLSDYTRFPEPTQTWKIIPVENGFNVQGCQSNTYLSLSSATNPKNKMPLSTSAVTLTITHSDNGFTINNGNLYLAHDRTGQFYAKSGSSSTIRIFQKVTAPAPVLGELTVALEGGSSKVTLKAMPAETGASYYYKSTPASDAANKPAVDSTNLTDWTAFTADTEIIGTNGTELFVQVIKVMDNKIKAWGESSATPAEPTPVDPLAIPGYTRVTSSNLEEGKYYMFVSKDAKGNLYAFYPDATHKDINPGNAIVGSTCPAGAFVADLTVDNAKGTVSAKWELDQSALEMKQLHFVIEKGNGYAFKGSNNLYLSLATAMLSDAPTVFNVSLRPDADNSFRIGTDKRVLVLNKVGDPSQFTKPGSKFNTNFWGPGDVMGLPIYLYTKDNEEAPIIVSKTALKQAIANAEKVKDNTLYTQESRDTLNAALQEAITERDSDASTTKTVLAATNKLIWATQGLVPANLAPDHPTPATGKTEDQPFINGVNGGSQTFRIPALTTLNNGWLAAAIDARWKNCPDGYGIDTLFSVSKDNGKTWEYNFPNYFNDSVGGKVGAAAAFIDPLMIQGKDDTIYLLTDVFPGGKYIVTAEESTGYETIGDKERMVLYTSQRGQSATNYSYYVGDFGAVEADGNAYAPVIAKGDDTMTAAYYVDDHYRLYTGDKKPMYCKQLDSNQYVQQSVFYSLANLHVRNATYLWLVTSKDNGQTWSAPTILNPMVRSKDKLVKFYGVGPGAGLTLEDGTIMMPCYTSGNKSDGNTQKSSFVYKNPGEDTWKCSDEATPDGDWSSESVLVQIDATTVRHFYRDGHSNLRYTDHVWDAATKTWKVESAPVTLPGVIKTINNQLSAIRYSKKVNGQDIIMVSTATTGNKARQNGKIYSFVLNEDKTMTLLSTYEITKPGIYYGYSSLTQKEDGSIGLLYETGTDIKYISIPLNKLVPGAVVDGKRTLDIPLYGFYEDTLTPLPTEEDLKALDPSIVRAELKGDKVIYTGISEGTASFTSNGITTTIYVQSVYPTQSVDLTCKGEYSVSVGLDASIVNSDPSVISAELTPVTITGGQGHTGTDATYSGDPLPLSSALYTFHQDGEMYQASGLAANNTKVWLNPEGNRGIPFATQATSIKFVKNADDTFFIQSAAGRYLYFWRDGRNTFDATSSASGNLEAGSKFLLYRPVNDGEVSSKELPGFVKTTELKDGGQYLIVADCNGTFYVARPSSNGTAFDHVLRADAALDSVTTAVSNTLTLKALKGGTASILVDGTAYLVTAKHQLTRVDRVEPTTTTEGNILYWHCALCGKNFLDEEGTKPVDDVVLPILMTPLEPSTPVVPDTPLTPLEPSTPVVPDTPLTPLEPSTPVVPDTPAQPDNNGGSSDNNNAAAPSTSAPAPTAAPVGRVPTGDNANLGLWLAVIVLAGAGIGGITYLRKRKGDK